MAFDIMIIGMLKPEILLAGFSLLLLLIGAIGGNRMVSVVHFGAVFVLATAFAIECTSPVLTGNVFSGMLVFSPYIHYSKLLVLGGATLTLLLAGAWLKRKEMSVFEYPVLILLAVTGMLVMVGSGSLLTFYVGLELTSLPLYVLASIQRDSLRSTEAGIKYFVLGSLASGMMLFGISLIYGFTGTLDFATLGRLFDGYAAAASSAGQPIAVAAAIVVGLILLIVGLCFKISAVPFHMWTPDVYEGSPTPVTAFFAVAPKIAALTLFARLMYQPFADLAPYWQQIIIVISAVTMMVGALGAIHQKNIKRLLAYSSIGHVGYALVAVATNNVEGAYGLMLYLSLYLFMSVGAFACVLCMRRKGQYVEDINELAGLSQSHPLMAAALSAFLLSMAGIPPLAGFYGKFYVFLAAFKSEFYVLAGIGMLSSVIAAYYYIKIVKIMYFDKPVAAFDTEDNFSQRIVMLLCALVTLFFFLCNTPFVAYAKGAVVTLF